MTYLGAATSSHQVHRPYTSTRTKVFGLIRDRSFYRGHFVLSWGGD